MKNKRFATVMLVILFLFSLTVNETNAKWPDKSGDLPGMVSDQEMILIAAGAGVLLTGLVVLLVVKKQQQKKLTNPSDDVSGYNSLGLNPYHNYTAFSNDLYKASEQSPLQFFASCNKNQNPIYSNNHALTVGVRIRF